VRLLEGAGSNPPYRCRERGFEMASKINSNEPSPETPTARRWLRAARISAVLSTASLCGFFFVYDEAGPEYLVNICFALPYAAMLALLWSRGGAKIASAVIFALTPVVFFVSLKEIPIGPFATFSESDPSDWKLVLTLLTSIFQVALFVVGAIGYRREDGTRAGYWVWTAVGLILCAALVSGNWNGP
jgi:hypothetical protein